MPAQHALLSPSSASRWLICTPSARLEAKHEDRASEASDEGTLAHKLSELLLKYDLKLIDKITFNKENSEIKKHKLYTTAMLEFCEQYKVFVLSKFAEAKERSEDAVIFLEQVVSLEHIAKESFGTRDVAIVSNGILDIIDLKFGKGVEVSAEENEQLMLYGAGTLHEFDPLFDIDTVRLNIYQPRISNFSTWEITAESLKSWAENTVKKQSLLAYYGKGQLVAGEHCMFCKAKVNCKALAKLNLEAAIHEFAEPAELSKQEMVDIFKKAQSIRSWLSSVEDYMLKQSLTKNVKWPGLKLVAGKSSRIIKDELKAIALLKSNKIRSSDYLSKPGLLGITLLEKNIGIDKLSKIIGRLIDKPEGKPTLVDKNDFRPEFNSAEAAVKAFGTAPNKKPLSKQNIKNVKTKKR